MILEICIFHHGCGSYGVKNTGKYICELKIWIWSFLLMPPSKTLIQVLIISPEEERNFPFLADNILWRSIFSLAERRESRMIMELKKLPKLNLGGYWSYVLINSTIFASFTLLISVLLCQNLASSILSCDDSLTWLIKFSLKSVVCRNNYIYNLALSYSSTILRTICQIESLFLHFFLFKSFHPSLLLNK